MSEDVSAYSRKLFVNDTAVQNLGITVEATGPGAAVARLEVTEGMLNGFGVCHGGHLFALADTAFAYACNTYGNVTVAAGASIEFLAPVYPGDRLTATAVERSRGGRQRAQRRRPGSCRVPGPFARDEQADPCRWRRPDMIQNSLKTP